MKKSYLLVFIITITILSLISVSLFFKVQAQSKITTTAQPKPATQKLDLAWKNFVKLKQHQTQAPQPVSLVVLGDVMYSRDVYRTIQKHHNDFDYPFAQTTDFLHSADIVFANLETPIATGPQVPVNSMVFHSPLGTETALHNANITLVSLANNHSMNAGQSGLVNTMQLLSKANVHYVGGGNNDAAAHTPTVITRNGVKFAFLAYVDPAFTPSNYAATGAQSGVAFMNDILRMQHDVQLAKHQADVVLVSMHSGVEYKALPNDTQTNFAHAAIDAGADVVLGQHPHVLEPVEEYKNKYIFYSAGNFVFDQMWSEPTQESVMTKLIFTGKTLSTIEFVPVHIEDYAQPRLTSDTKITQSIFSSLQIQPKQQFMVNWDATKKDYTISTQAALYPTTTSTALNYKVLSDQTKMFTLNQGAVTITENNKTIWKSASNWWVSDIALGDVQGNGEIDLVLDLWKEGNYGPDKPLWVKQNDPSIKNHLFVFHFVKSTKTMTLEAVWQSSNLTKPNCGIVMNDLNHDGKAELIVLEGDYTNNYSCSANHVAVWQWNNWGFENNWRSTAGKYRNLQIESLAGQNRVVVDNLP